MCLDFIWKLYLICPGLNSGIYPVIDLHSEPILFYTLLWKNKKVLVFTRQRFKWVKSRCSVSLCKCNSCTLYKAANNLVLTFTQYSNNFANWQINLHLLWKLQNFHIIQQEQKVDSATGFLMRTATQIKPEFNKHFLQVHRKKAEL